MVFVWSLVFGAWCYSSSAAFVYETPAEFLTSGDFNGDGILDVLVLDKATGNARVGYQSPTGALIWSATLITGVDNVSGAAIGRFLQTGRDTLAIVSSDYNSVPLLDLSQTNSASTAFSTIPLGIGPHTLAALAQPFVPPTSSFDTLLVASAFNNPPAERLELTGFSAGPITSTYGPYNETGLFERGNALQMTTNSPTFATGIVRGDTNDALHIWQFTNAPGLTATLSNLPPASDYVFGRFDGQALPYFWFYVPGQSNVTIRQLVPSGGGFAFGTAISLNFTEAVQNVYYAAQGSDGSAFIRFGDGIQGARLPGGLPQLAAKYAGGGGASGNAFTGIVDLNNGRFALFSAPTGTVSSLRAQVMTFDGTNYTQISSNNLPAVSTRSNRATVWLFQSEPFTNAAAMLIASRNVPDWSSGVSGLPASLSVRAESDAGTSSGLGSPVTNNLGVPPAGTAYALPDQYRDDISFFTYAPARPAEPVVITISPPPGNYAGPIQISFIKQNPAHQVFYRIGMADSWKLYSAPFTLTNDATIQYYGNIPGSTRGRLQFASYMLGNIAVPPESLVTLPGSDTNPPPVVNTNITKISANGTVIYGRRSPLGTLNGFLGPSPYLSFADSPFNHTNGMTYFYLEDFEDGSLNTPGVTPSAGWVVASPGSFTDSVDGDDGTINGSGAGGHSYYSGGSQTNLTITFNAALLGGHLPTHAGIVWTDVGIVSSGVTGHGNVIFSARDANGVLIGAQVAINLGDGVGSATTAEDRFFGVVNASGIASISITMTNSGDWEVDHLQYGRLESSSFTGGIWAINLDGSGEQFITAGLRPRVSHDGHWMSFLRENDPATNQFSLCVRDLATGQEVRLHSSSNRYVGHDWTPDNTNIVFDNNCLFWRIGLSGPATQLPLSSDCRQGAPSVNPLDGRLAFQIIYPGTTGLYVTPPDGSAKQNLNLSVLSPRWPAWSPDGQRIAIADDPSISQAIDAGYNLWVVELGAQTNVYQITALTGDSAFPNGAVWTPNGNKLVAAGRIGGVNGLWVIPLAADGSACHCPPQRLPTAPGDDIDFAGGVVSAGASVGYANLGLFIRLDLAAVVVYWSTNYDGFALESAEDMPAGLSWSPVSGPYFRAGPYFEYRESRAELSSRKYFRLHYPGVLVLTPPEPGLEFHVEPNAAVLNWPLNYVGYKLEASTNLSPPILWTPLGGPYLNTNGVFEYRRTLPGPPQEFYRLRGP